MKIDDVGIKIAESIVDFFKNEENLRLINSLKDYGVKFENENTNNLNSRVLNDMVFVISGVFKKYSRMELKDEIEKNGGKVSSSISKKTSYLLAGSNPGPSKIDKAKQNQIKTINENLCFVPFFKKADLIAIMKSSLFVCIVY